MKMKENFKILAEFVKDISSETADAETYIYVKEKISKYHLNISINSKALKDKMIEVNTTLNFDDKELSEKRSYFEIVYISIVKIDDAVNNKKDLEKIILCDVQNKIYPNLEKTFLNLVHNSGFQDVGIEKKIDFTELYKQRPN
jgi:preprotein translocase subunit SecB